MRLRECRLKKGFTQKEMADRLECTVVTYQRYESGVREPSILILKKLSSILKVSIDYLVDNYGIETEAYECRLIEASRNADETAKQYALELLTNHQNLN